MPAWLVTLAWVSVGLALLSAATVAGYIVAGHRQPMWIMNLVWPITALYAGPLGLWAFLRFGRPRHRRPAEAGRGTATGPAPRPASDEPRPRWQKIAMATTHCGSGCALGDICAECAVALVPLPLFGREIFGAWALDYALAFLFGIAFQYFTITPMRKLSPWEGLRAALKADAVSLTAWQVGMYGWMALVVFGLVGHPCRSRARYSGS